MRFFIKLTRVFQKDKRLYLLLGLFILHMFLRLYNLEDVNPFGWDQVDNAWAARNIIDDGQLPLVGMQAKNNSGLYIGPLYYYFVAGVYFLTDLDPLASPIIAFLTSVLTFITLFWVTKKVFSFNVAFVATFIYTVSYYAIIFDRIQWPVNFIMLISLLTFYALYQVILGKEKYILHLAAIIGFSFHIHFTSIFYPLIVLLCLPLFPRTKKTLMYTGIGIGIFLLFLSPIIAHVLINASNASNFASYSSSNYHGFHFRRFMQVAHDAFIKFDSVLRLEQFTFLKYVLIPLFLVTYIRSEKKPKTAHRVVYLIVLFFLIPWLIFTVYRGEISDYYFTQTLPFVYVILAYFTVKLFFVKYSLVKAVVVLAWVAFSYSNMQHFFEYKDSGSLALRRKTVENAIKNGSQFTYDWGVPEPFFYYLHIRKNGNDDDMKRFFKKL